MEILEIGQDAGVIYLAFNAPQTLRRRRRNQPKM